MTEDTLFEIYEIYGKTRCTMNEGVIIRNKEKNIEIRVHCDDAPHMIDILLRFVQFLFPEKEPVTDGDKAIKKIFHKKGDRIQTK